MSTIERETVTELPQVLDPRVERGAALLDETLPGWWEMIDLERFDIERGDKCVLGQIGLCVYDRSSYRDTADKLLGDAYGDDAYSHGFLGSPAANAEGDSDWQRLEQDWRLAILSRREP